MSTTTSKSQLGARATIAAACLCFFALGIAISAIGPALPDLAARADRSLDALGGLFSALFLGALITQLAAGPLIDRLGQRPVLLAGMGLFALGTFGYATSRWLPLSLACALIAGLGQGALVIGYNVLTARVFADRSAAALNLSNVFFGAGDVAGPAIAGLALRSWGVATPALLLGAALTLLPSALLPLLPPAPIQTSQAGAPSSGPIYRSPLLWALGVLLLLYVGTEISVAGWTATYLLRTTALGGAAAALVTSGFWLAVTVGRVCAVFLSARLTPNKLLQICLAGALSGAILLVLSLGDAPLTIAAVLLIGLCFGPVYPTVIAIAAAGFGERSSVAISIVSALGSLGGMLLPWLQGNLLARGGPSASTFLVAAGTLAMLALHAGRGLLANSSVRVK